MSHPGYLPDWHVDWHGLLKVTFSFFQMSSEHGGRDKPKK